MNPSGPPILVSPLNWGLGHASRCIPLVRALLEADFEPVLAGDGSSLDLLAAEFPALRKYELPSYDIRYAKDSRFFKLGLMFQGPHLFRAIEMEKTAIEKIIEEVKPAGIISDNRFGVRSSKVPSVYVTHQLQVKAGWMTGVATRWHQKLISGFDQCWVCDYSNLGSLAGTLSSDPGTLKNTKWIGPLSRFTQKKEVKKDIDVAVILSGPEPSRSLFQEKLMRELQGSNQKIILVEGLVDGEQNKRQELGLTIYNYLLSEELETLINRSKMVIVRSGYSSIMDLHAMGARALLIPTPGQTEQEYLASYLEQKGICHSVKEDEFSLGSLRNAANYPGFTKQKTSKSESLTSLFDVFR